MSALEEQAASQPSLTQGKTAINSPRRDSDSLAGGHKDASGPHLSGSGGRQLEAHLALARRTLAEQLRDVTGPYSSSQESIETGSRVPIRARARRNYGKARGADASRIPLTARRKDSPHGMVELAKREPLGRQKQQLLDSLDAGAREALKGLPVEERQLPNEIEARHEGPWESDRGRSMERTARNPRLGGRPAEGRGTCTRARGGRARRRWWRRGSNGARAGAHPARNRSDPIEPPRKPCSGTPAPPRSKQQQQPQQAAAAAATRLRTNRPSLVRPPAAGLPAGRPRPRHPSLPPTSRPVAVVMDGRMDGRTDGWTGGLRLRVPPCRPSARRREAACRLRWVRVVRSVAWRRRAGPCARRHLAAGRRA
eukprot:scaffold3884_cov392-Prasinococcus_capsulatus_cf.AAC.12